MDSKGRISMPTKYRDQLTQLVLLPNPVPSEPCLFIYSLDEWQKVIDQIVALPNTAGNRKIKRAFMGKAESVTLDSNGRFLLKPELRESALLDKKVYLVGQGNKLELWDEATYNTDLGNFGILTRD